MFNAKIVRLTACAFLLLGLSQCDAQAPMVELVRSDPVPVEYLSQHLTSVDSPIILALTREVFALAGASGPYEDVARPFIKLTAESQVRFLEGKISPTSEQCVVNIVNRAAATVRAPNYLRTNQDEVHRLREELATVEPSFIGRLTIKNKSDTKPLGDLMSPLEAFHVISLLVRQKFYNPDYQMTAEERAELLAIRPDKKPQLPAVTLLQRQHELEKLIRDAPKSVSVMDLFQLATVSFTEIGVGEEHANKRAGGPN